MEFDNYVQHAVNTLQHYQMTDFQDEQLLIQVFWKFLLSDDYVQRSTAYQEQPNGDIGLLITQQLNGVLLAPAKIAVLDALGHQILTTGQNLLNAQEIERMRPPERVSGLGQGHGEQTDRPTYANGTSVRFSLFLITGGDGALKTKQVGNYETAAPVEDAIKSTKSIDSKKKKIAQSQSSIKSTLETMAKSYEARPKTERETVGLGKDVPQPSLKAWEGVHAEDLWFQNNFATLRSQLNGTVVRLELLVSVQPCGSSTKNCLGRYMASLRLVVNALCTINTPILVYTFRDDFAGSYQGTAATQQERLQSVYEIVNGGDILSRLGVWKDPNQGAGWTTKRDTGL